MESAPKVEDHDLRHQLQVLLEEARLNEKKLRRFDQFERSLISAHSLSNLIQVILHGYRAMFDNEAVTLVLLDPEYEITRMLEQEQRGSSKIPGLVFLEKFFNTSIQPYLGHFDADAEGAIFDPWPAACRSMALLPLMRQGEPIGSLNLGSSQADRFRQDSGTVFLERMVAIFSICLENALNLERLRQAGLSDHLTGVHNRRYFETRCLEEAMYAWRHGKPLACMFLDIDKFKRINDSLGHLAGDDVLRKVAQIIKSQLRSNDVVARYGGEEFVVLMPQTTLTQTNEIAERIRAMLEEQPLRVASSEFLAVTISIGIAMLPEKGAGNGSDAVHEMIRRADVALYQAKKTGRNRVVCATDPI